MTRPISRDRFHRFANLIVGFKFPRAWIRGLSDHKYRKLVKYVRNVWLIVNDNNVERMKRPAWVSKRYIYG